MSYERYIRSQKKRRKLEDMYRKISRIISYPFCRLKERHEKTNIYRENGIERKKTMHKYVKKPVVVEAWQFTKQNFKKQNFRAEAPEWIRTGNREVTLWSQFGGEVIGGEIKTLEGVHTVSENDYIIKGIKGEFYPCKPDIFEATYDKVDE